MHKADGVRNLERSAIAVASKFLSKNDGDDSGGKGMELAPLGCAPELTCACNGTIVELFLYFRLVPIDASYEESNPRPNNHRCSEGKDLQRVIWHCYDSVHAIALIERYNSRARTGDR